MTTDRTDNHIVAEGASDAHLTPKELAARFHVSPGTLAQWRSAGRGPRFMRVGGTGTRGPVLYRVSDVEAYEEKITRASTSEAAR